MNARNRLAALLAAGSLVMALAAVTSAAPPTYSLSVDKSANPANVPVAGTSVVYTIAVAATGTGFFGTVNVDDGMAGCTLAGPTGDTDTDGNLDPGETWSYTCTVTGVVPDTANTATVIACHNSSGACNQTTQDATASDTFTVGTGPDITEPPATEPPATEPPATVPPATEPPATEPPATEPPATVPPATVPPASAPPASAPPASAPPASVNPSADVADDVDATMPSSDTAIGGGAAKPADRSWMLVVALGMLLASIVVVSPSRTAREERE